MFVNISTNFVGYFYNYGHIGIFPMNHTIKKKRAYVFKYEIGKKKKLESH